MHHEATKKTKDLDIVSKKNENPMDMDVERPPEKPIQSSEENDIDQETTKEDQATEVPHIDFIFSDRSLILEDCVQTTGRQTLKHLTVRSNTKASFRFQKQQYSHSASKWKTKLNSVILNQASMPCEGNKDQAAN